jgi:hypothetical protein
MCDGDAICGGTTCVAPITDCEGAPASATTQPIDVAVLNPTSRCSSGAHRGYFANSFEQAERCARREGFTVAPIAALEQRTWGQPDSTCADGDFWALPEDLQRCADALCGCTGADLGDPLCH